MSTKIHWKGKALLLAGIPAWLVTLLAFIFLIAIVLSLIFCTFTQRIDVRGEVITLPHSVNVFAPQQGFVVNLHVKVGDIVKKANRFMNLTFHVIRSVATLARLRLKLSMKRLLTPKIL